MEHVHSTGLKGVYYFIGRSIYSKLPFPLGTEPLPAIRGDIINPIASFHRNAWSNTSIVHQVNYFLNEDT